MLTLISPLIPSRWSLHRRLTPLTGWRGLIRWWKMDQVSRDRTDVLAPARDSIAWSGSGGRATSMRESGVATMDRSPEDREKNRPKHRISAPLRSRHALESINRNSRPKNRNSVVLPGIDTGGETELIRQGYGDSLGNNRWRTNGRVYVRKGNERGTLYPESGEGVRNLSRFEFKALVLLITFGGYTEGAQRQFARDDLLTVDVVLVALELYELRPRE